MGEIAQGMIATSKGTRPSVVTFAQMLVQMHTTAEQRERTLANTLNLTPADNPVATQLRTTSDAIVARLNAASTSDFDAVYVSSQVDVHEQVLALIDNTLLPNAQNAALRAELTTARGEVQMHLADARALAATLDISVDAGM
jgi:putative membrane protein